VLDFDFFLSLLALFFLAVGDSSVCFVVILTSCGVTFLSLELLAETIFGAASFFLLSPCSGFVQF